jgi:arylsulfatase A-like enzyme
MVRGLRLFVGAAALAFGIALAQHNADSQRLRRPNILFIILDDVGIDQLRIFNPYQLTPPATPNIDAVASAGVMFTNMWTMPECSPSRACFFTGRYPLRTGVTDALTDLDQPRAQVSPYEVTAPRLVARAGYRSALIGKFHLGMPQINPAGIRMAQVLGWDYYNGNIYDGEPPDIDPTLGGQYTADSARYSCGFPAGPQRGACWFLDRSGRPFCDDQQGAGYTGQECAAMGGIAALDAGGDFAPTCQDAAPQPPDFTQFNGYYVWPFAITGAGPVRTGTVRRYATVSQTDTAIEWVRQVPRGHPWMCSVAYNAMHVPYQLPPADLYPPGSAVPTECASLLARRELGNLMLEAMDEEIGRLLVGLGLASRGADGRLVYRPEASDTMVVIAGDNGTLFASVKFPYDPAGSKATVYQTGTSAPLIVAGPLVRSPGRRVGHMVNCVDLFQLFGEIAGLNVRQVVPPSHALDCQPMLAYLTNPSQPSFRRYNFTQQGEGLKKNGTVLWPCVVSVKLDLTPKIHIEFDACTTLLPSKRYCKEQNGAWFGPEPDNPWGLQLADCCEIKARGLYPNLILFPNQQWSVRNNRYKLVKLQRPPCEASLGEFQFFDLTPNFLNPVGLDIFDLLTNGRPVNLTPEQRAAFEELKREMNRLLASEVPCPGDGNQDRRVNGQDILGVLQYWGHPSVFDFNNDGTTDRADLDIVIANYGRSCPPG